MFVLDTRRGDGSKFAARRATTLIASRRESKYSLHLFRTGDHSMWAIDHPSMILIILAGINLGLKSAFDIDLVDRYMGTTAILLMRSSV
jgi:hypothetical protein